MKLLNPVPSLVTRTALAPRLATLDGATIGLWSNGKINAAELLVACEAELRARHNIAGVVRGSYHAAKAHESDEFAPADACQAVILTHGD
jgi:hypothetical protein